MTQKDNQNSNQFSLMVKRKFAPFFWTQFLGAFNDNIYKNALILIIVYSTSSAMDSSTLVNLAAGLFILPFFLFSAIAGQVADMAEKSALISKIKILEIIIMSCAAFAFFTGSTILLMLLLFLMGTQSTFFGPVKYSIIPQHLAKAEIVGGNAMVQMGTNVAILLGTMTSGLLVQLEYGRLAIAVTVVSIACIGWLVCLNIPDAPSAAIDKKINWNMFSQTFETIKIVRKDKNIFLSVLGISWFWFLGAAYLTQVPNFTKLILKGSESVVTLLLTTFIIGIGTGSLFCEKLSGKKLELGLVPLGSLGLSIFGIDLFFAYATPDIDTLMGLSGYFSTSGSIRVLVDLFMIGIFGGLYIVPLFSFVQLNTTDDIRARVIAGNNILNALFMVFSAIFGILLLGVAGLSVKTFFLIIAVMNFLVALYIYKVMPVFGMRFLIWMFTHFVYRIHHKNLKEIPEEGPALIVCNHISYADAPIIGGMCKRPVRFVMLEDYYNLPILNFICRTGRAIPITNDPKRPGVIRKAFKEIKKALNDGDLVVIFPEGKMTKDGEIDTFQTGTDLILKQNQVPVVPMALRGLWGSFFSHKGSPPLRKIPKRLWPKVELIVGKTVMPEDATITNLQNVVTELRGMKQ
ncbi:MAG: MFS transporter [Desulfobacterales bacterium]|nr:MFS transporter [Desulfobacterales bacterium]